jgi:hypothetical protein
MIKMIWIMYTITAKFFFCALPIVNCPVPEGLLSRVCADKRNLQERSTRAHKMSCWVRLARSLWHVLCAEKYLGIISLPNPSNYCLQEAVDMYAGFRASAIVQVHM